ncbi:MAG TPA: translation initiation factor IF-2 [Thermoleophilia bacterium]
MAKRRVYEIALDNGLKNQQLVDLLKAAGLEVHSSLSSVEEADALRVLAARPTAAEKAAAKKAAAKKAPAKKVAAPPKPRVEAKADAIPVVPRPSPAAQADKEAAPATKPGVPKKAAIAEASDVAQGSAALQPPVVQEEVAAEGAAAPVQPEAAAETAAVPVAVETVSIPRAPEVSVPTTVEAAPFEITEPGTGTAAPEAGPAAEQPVAAEESSVAEARPEDGRPEGPRPLAPRKPVRARGRGPRLEDMPTVVGPGVPLRKGVKPSGNVVTKEELAERLKAEKEERVARAEAARKAAASPPPPRPPKAAEPEPPSLRPQPARPPAPVARPVGHSSVARDAAERRVRPVRVAPEVAPETWEEGTEPVAAALPSRVPAASRVRRGDDKPAKRRVIIDSQAGRKGGRGGFRDRRTSIGDVEKPLAKRKVVPGTESPAKVKSGASVKDVGEVLEIGAGELIKTLLNLGEMVTITQSLSDDAIMILAEEFERQVEIEHAEEEIETSAGFVDEPGDLTDRAPVVTIMGHVDHGKTSLLDAIRETEVVKSEAGGITQHIGAYQVTHKDKKVTFLDTPGHEAFTAMRARGAKSTDIAVIVVAANDGVMPQTLEAISHAKAAEVPILVAINKMDLPDANPDMVKNQLSEQGLVPEEWGGDTVMVQVSAKQRTNLEDLMDMILLVAEVMELKANATASASGVVIEAQLDVGRGPVATVLVQRGTLHVGDAVASGEAYGKVKAMFDFTGKALTKAGPAVPVQILGFNTLPAAGDFVTVARDEREARQKAEQRTARLRQEQVAKSRGGASSLDEFYRRLKEGKVKELPLVIKGDVGGSVEALEEALRNITHAEVKVEVVFAGVGGINESDIMLASASKAVVIGFNVRPSVAAKALAEQEHVDVRTYRVIYKAIEDVEAALVGMLEPEHVEEELGTAEVRQVFRASRIGLIAGCYVQTGKITRSAKIRIVRDGSIVHEGSIGSLKRFQDDVREVAAGYECGLHIDGFDDLRESDIIEAYEIKEVARTQ